MAKTKKAKPTARASKPAKPAGKPKPAKAPRSPKAAQPDTAAQAAAPRLFGTDGIRDVAGSGALTPENILGLGRALGRYLAASETDGSQRPRVLLGVDPRPSADLVGTALTAGLVGECCDVYWPGMMSTPEVAFLTRHGPFSAGVAITASHNPARDNGIKIFAKSGHKLPDAVERKLEAEVARGVAGQAAPPRGGRFGWMQLGRERHYEEFLLKTFRASFANLVSRPLRVVFDCAFGARSIDLQTISSLAKSVQLGRSAPELRVGSPMSTSAENSGNALDVVFLNAASPNRPEEHHLINAETGSQHPKSCARAVKELQADLGVCFDGDGDRCILIDETGQVRDGDDLLGVLAADLHEQGRLENSVVVGTTMANMGLEVFLRGLGLKFVRADVGDRFVAEAMRREGAKLGGEASGHLIIADEGYDIGDGLYTALRIVEIMLDKQKPLSALCAGIRRHPQVLVNVPVREKPPLENLKSVSEAIRNANRRLRDSRVLVRYSGTEPVLRVMVESTTAELAQQTADEIADAARREIGL